MKKIMLIGGIGCGKTTLCQSFNRQDRIYHKTQTVQVVGSTIDTPGEYIENRALLRGLIVTAVEADEVLFMQDCTSRRFCFSPGQAAMFACPVVGVVSKADLAESPRDVEQAIELLQTAGAKRIFVISTATGQGLAELSSYLGIPPENAAGTA